MTQLRLSAAQKQIHVYYIKREKYPETVLVEQSSKKKKKVLTFLFTENSNNQIFVLGISSRTKLFQMKKITNLFAYISSYQNAEEQRLYSTALHFPPKEKSRQLHELHMMSHRFHLRSFHCGETCR